MIIYCPKCLSETLLTKSQECDTGWKCDKCNMCCITKPDRLVVNESNTVKNTENLLNYEIEKKENNSNVISTKEHEQHCIDDNQTIKTQQKLKSHQLSMFNYH